MGFCFSTLSRDNNATDSPPTCTDQHHHHHPEVQPAASSSPTNTAQPTHPATSLADATTRITTTRSRSRRLYPAHFPLGEHFNSPLRPHTWYSKRRSWTRAQLDQERREFFETRVTGRLEVWAALSAVVSFMQMKDFATAQSMVDAAGVTVPTGDVCEGCYDEQGVLYRLPQCIVSDPENMVEEEEEEEEEEEDSSSEYAGLDVISEDKLGTDEASGDELITADLERRRNEKGKTTERQLIRVQARLSDRGDPDLVLSVGRNQSVSYIARRIHEEAELAEHQRLKLVYLGKVLKENRPLVDQGWNPDNVINALVVSPTPVP